MASSVGVEGAPEDKSVLHVVVVGFHHKKGCQIEYAYPPLLEGQPPDSHDLPDEWKYLPFLALPDGAHNFEEDFIYFHLPGRGGSKKTVYGVSCYRQIDAKDLINREADMTRETVQKSVCVLSHLPLFGLIKAKLELCTVAYFGERDFSKVTILKELHDNLSGLLCSDLIDGPQVFIGLSARDLVLRFKHKLLVIFKLLLLERRVLFYSSPVGRLSTTLLSLLSLFPGVIQQGLSESVSHKIGTQISTELILSDFGIDTEEYLEVQLSAVSGSTPEVQPKTTVSEEELKRNQIDIVGEILPKDGGSAVILAAQESSENSAERDEDADRSSKTSTSTYSTASELTSPTNMSGISSDWEKVEKMEVEEAENELKALSSSENGLTPRSSDGGNVGDTGGMIESDVTPKSSPILSPSPFPTDEFGFPLAVFTKGSVCHPYLALQHHELLQDVNIRSFLVGATNILFKQRRHLTDVIVDIEEDKIEIYDAELRKQLHLHTADLRFADFLVKHVVEERDDIFLDGTAEQSHVGWEGGDEWVRSQFCLYLLSLLSTTENGAQETNYHDFNTQFVEAYKTTHNYRLWKATLHDGIDAMHTGHPFMGQYSAADIKLRLSHVMQNTERGKRLGTAVAKTGQAVNTAVQQTGKAVGGALNQAKSAMSNWWANLNQDWKAPEGE
ncbi:late secretory pathway protein AVL9 homolog isoform X1 [Branchiostoma floridae]|uniref:Late secretory pathway protein AVL9 homolog isoform X1 n=1 Tax=Branchiostoma floridae TaxID=7739 RepID=A0A9J7LU91_BRAFL|nr:late secretory pathway protein AVL9 homolog isoform X1 [Branchiostoma floridae]